ncbi:hypothetical protein B0J14DRAFT_568305 [Halenospora varia]|nr:hypothetical protein B0J14DRAFT_568305 [Halenospora varia]
MQKEIARSRGVTEEREKKERGKKERGKKERGKKERGKKERGKKERDKKAGENRNKRLKAAQLERWKAGMAVTSKAEDYDAKKDFEEEREIRKRRRREEKREGERVE